MEKTNNYIILIVGIVAVVGLVLSFSGNSISSDEAIAGQAIQIDSIATQTGDTDWLAQAYQAKLLDNDKLLILDKNGYKVAIVIDKITYELKQSPLTAKIDNTLILEKDGYKAAIFIDGILYELMKSPLTTNLEDEVLEINDFSGYLVSSVACFKCR